MKEYQVDAPRYIMMKESVKERSIKPLFVAFTGIGLAAGLVGREIIDIDTEYSSAQQPEPIVRDIGDEVIYEATMVDQLNKILNPTATVTLTSTATWKPMAKATAIDYCNEPQDGKICVVPKSTKTPPPTPTPYPDCSEAIKDTDTYGGKKCQWKVE